MADSYMDHRPILPGVVDPIGKCLALRQAGEIFGMDLPGLPLGPPRATRIFKGSDELYVRNTNRNWLTLLARSDEKVEEAGCCNARRGANL